MYVRTQPATIGVAAGDVGGFAPANRPKRKPHAQKTMQTEFAHTHTHTHTQERMQQAFNKQNRAQETENTLN